MTIGVGARVRWTGAGPFLQTFSGRDVFRGGWRTRTGAVGLALAAPRRDDRVVVAGLMHARRADRCDTTPRRIEARSRTRANHHLMTGAGRTTARADQKRIGECGGAQATKRRADRAARARAKLGRPRIAGCGVGGSGIPAMRPTRPTVRRTSPTLGGTGATRGHALPRLARTHVCRIRPRAHGQPVRAVTHRPVRGGRAVARAGEGEREGGGDAV